MKFVSICFKIQLLRLTENALLLHYKEGTVNAVQRNTFVTRATGIQS
jgi:hypothetical protein